MESDRGDVGGVALECVDEGFGLVVPHVDGGIVCPAQQVRLISPGVVVNAVDTLGVTL